MVAIKVESCISNKQVLKIEALVIKRLQGLPHTCELHGCGRTDRVNFIVMSLLGQNLSDLRKKQDKQVFSLSTVLRLAVQSIVAVQGIHNCGFLHRDIKPSNFAMGLGEKTRNCFLIDFGLARQYTTLTGELKQPRPFAGFRGTVRYASINAHLGNELGRHDDLWSVFYMLVELTTGSLPWRRIREKEEAGKAKQECDHDELIKGLPEEFKLFMNHLKGLKYHDKPDYQYLINLFLSAQKKFGINSCDPYDWESDFVLPPSASAGVSPPINSQEQYTTPEIIDSAQLKKDKNESERSFGDKVKKICKVFQTMNSPKSAQIASSDRRNFSNEQQITDKTKQHVLKSPENNTPLHSNQKNNNGSSNDINMQIDCINDKCSTDCELERSKCHHIPSADVCDNNVVGVLPNDKAFNTNSEQSHVSSMERQSPLNTGFIVVSVNNEGMSKDVSFSCSEDGPIVKKFERVDSPLLSRTGPGQRNERNDLVSTLDTPVEKTQLLTSSLVIIPRPPIVPPRSGYFCSSARKRKFVKIGQRIFAAKLD